MKKDNGKNWFFKKSVARAEAIKKAKSPGANNKFGEYIETGATDKKEEKK